MDESTPPLPVRPGSTRYILATVVVGAVVAGIWLSLRRGDGEAPAPPRAAAPALSVKPRALPPPPPPPPLSTALEAVDSGSLAPVAAKQPTPQSGPSPCAEPCRGDATPALRSQLTASGKQSRGCYERALRGVGTLSGRVVVGLRIGAEGQVCSASLVSDALGEPSVGACILQRLQATVFPKPRGGCVDVRVPIHFVPNG